MTYTYVLESSHELTSIASLLRGGHVAGAVEPIVRALVERAGRVNWVLDGGSPEERADSDAGRNFVDVRRRTARACLEYLADLQHTAKSEGALGPTELGTKMDEQLRTDFGLIGQWFAVLPAKAEAARLAGNKVPPISGVTIGGERYPKYTDLAHFALNARVSEDRARGLYSALSGWSHPNFLAARIHNGPDGTYVHSFGHLADLIEAALLSYANALQRFIEYFDANRDPIGATLEKLFGRWYALTERDFEISDDVDPSP
jgi:hypothetical protein